MLWTSTNRHQTERPALPKLRVDYAGEKNMEKEEKRTAPIGVRVRPSLRRELKSMAAADKRSLAVYIEIILEDWVAKHKAESSKPAGKRK